MKKILIALCLFATSAFADITIADKYGDKARFFDKACPERLEKEVGLKGLKYFVSKVDGVICEGCYFLRQDIFVMLYPDGTLGLLQNNSESSVMK